MKKTLIGAGSDLGVHIHGASLAPKIILKKWNLKKIYFNQEKNIQKSQDKFDLKKNLIPLNNFNEKLYTIIKKEKNFCITIGGDHSISIASALASLKKEKNLGLIWIDSHVDYNTFQTTITGNLHGLPLATLNGLNQELSKFYEGNYFDPKKTVVVGYRALEENAMAEITNIQTMGVTVYTTEDIKRYGVNKIMEEAFSIASKNTLGLHISFDLDVLDPVLSPGVTVKEENGITIKETEEILDFLTKEKKLIKSFDLVEYNPLNDKEDTTLKIVNHILKKIIDTIN